MKKSLVIYLVLFLSIRTYAQKTTNDSLADFNYVHFQEHLSEIKDKIVRENYAKSVERNFIKNKYNLFTEKTIVSSAVATSTCGNFDFEDGNANGWTMAGDYQIMSGTGTDPFGGFPVVCPGGNFSLRLNDNNTSAVTCSPPGTKNTFTSTATKNITITAANSMVKVNFAACFLAFPHTQNDAANMGIEFFDALNNPLTVPTFTAKYTNPPGSIVASMPVVSSTSTLQGLQICGFGNYPVEYLPWQQKQFNLSAYVGQTIKIKLTAAWCLYQYDWGYAYFDVCCDGSCPQIINPYIASNTITNICANSTLNTNLCSSTSTNINYNWFGSMGPMATGSCITVSSPGSYTLQSTSPTNTAALAQEVFNLGLNPTVSFSVSSNVACKNSSSGVTLFVSPSGGVFSGPGISGNTFQPWSVAVGIYTITYVYTDPYAGCKDSLAQTIQVTTCKTTNLLQNFKVSELIIAPNPFTSQIVIKCNDLPENSEFILFNTLGQEILRKRLSDGKNSIETEALPPGLYIYSLLSQNKQVKQGKLVKE